MSPVKIPAEAYAALERRVAERIAQGLKGYVALRVEIHPRRKRIAWLIVAGEAILETGEEGWPAA